MLNTDQQLPMFENVSGLSPPPHHCIYIKRLIV